MPGRGVKLNLWYLHEFMHTSIFIESSVSQCINVCSIRTTPQAVGTALGRGQKVHRALDQTALQS